MLRTRIFICFLVLVLAGLVALPAFGQSEYVKTLGGGNSDGGRSVVEVSGGGIVVTGSTRSYGAGYEDLLLVKFNSAGTLLWTKTLGGSGGYDYGNSVVEASDGGLVVTGWTNTYGAGDYDILLSKFNSSGTHQWTRTLGGADPEKEVSVIEASDGGFVVAGWTDSFGAGNSDLLLAKFNSSGTHQWTRTLGGINLDCAKSLTELSDGGLAVIGHTENYGAGGYDLLLAKFNSSGTHQWTRTLGGIDNDYGTSVVEVSDGGIVVAGQTDTYGAGGYDLLLAKFNSSGTHQWTRTLGGSSNEDCRSVVEAFDGGIVVTLWTSSYGVGNDDLLLAKFNSSGTHQWSWVLGGSDYDFGYSVIEFSDGGFVVTGSTRTYGAGDYDLLLAKYDMNGSTCMGGFVTPTLSSPSPSIGTPTPTIGSPSPTITTPSPTSNSPTPGVTVVCESTEPVPVPLFNAPMMTIMVLAILIISAVIIKRRVVSRA